MNWQLIKQHGQCLTAIDELNLSRALTTHKEPNVLLQCISVLKESNVQKKFESLYSDCQLESFKSVEVLKHVISILEQINYTTSLSNLIKQAGADNLLSYDVSDIVSVLSGGNIPSSRLWDYLQYYKDKKLSDEELRNLWKGLDNFYMYHQEPSGMELSTCYAILKEPVAASTYLNNTTYFDSEIANLLASKDYLELLNCLALINVNVKYITEESLHELYADSKQILTLLKHIQQFFSGEHFTSFCELWLANHALVYDLKFLKTKTRKPFEGNLDGITSSRAAYVSFLYNEYFPQEMSEAQQDLIIYAVANKKKAFIKLIHENFDIFEKLPNNSLLLASVFYKDCVNINTINKAQLKLCISLTMNKTHNNLSLLANRNYTFEEVRVLYGCNKTIIDIYKSLSITSVDARLRVIKEVTSHIFYLDGADLQSVARKLSEKPLSHWMQEDFQHIRRLSRSLAIRLLCKYDDLCKFIPELHTVGEVQHLLRSDVKQYSSMTEIREHVIEDSGSWHDVKAQFNISDTFESEYADSIRTLIFNGIDVVAACYQHTPKHCQEPLRRLLMAELMGRFKEVKHHKGDLEQELDCELDDRFMSTWVHNKEWLADSVRIWEEDGFIPTLTAGEIPIHTCLSYKDGKYSECLFANFDSNKKLLYVSIDEEIVLRAVIRLTKGTFDLRVADKRKGKALQFADLETEDKAVSVDDSSNILFLERPYSLGIPEGIYKDLIRYVVKCMQEKATELGVQLVLNSQYEAYVGDNWVAKAFAVYISKSKAASQYIDSVGGEATVSKEGSYAKGKFLFSK